VSTWDIDPAGVQAVLTRTTDAAAGFDSALKSLSSSVEGAAAQSASGPVASALSGFAGAMSADVQAVFQRSQAAVTGCVNAVNAYVAGDLEMAAHAQASASAAPSGEFAGGGMRNGPR
jgi:uncharacterized protein DUF6507